jgi:hypothetical protein
MKFQLKYNTVFHSFLKRERERIVNVFHYSFQRVRMHNSIVVHVCAINFFYVFIVPGPILRHLGEFGKIRLLLGENTRFLPEEGQYGYLEDGL